MAFPKWFNEVEYLEAKRVLLNANAGANGHRYASILEVSDAIKAAGMNAFEHYNTFGSKEGLNPSKIFNAYEYCSFKLKALQADAATKGEWATKSWQDVQLAIHNSGMSLGDHYTMFGTVEGISMSNAFDTTAYLTAKLELLKANEATKGEWATKTVTDVANAIKAIGMDAYTHYMTFKGGANEVDPSQSFASKDPVGGGDSNTFILDGSTNNIVGTAGDDLIIGEGNALRASHTIDGGAGTDTMNLIGASNYDNVGLASIKNVEIIKTIGGTGTAIDTSGLADVKEVWGVKAGAGRGYTVAKGQTVGLEGSQTGTSTINVKGADGIDDSLNMVLKDASTVLAIDATGNGGMLKVENLNIAASGANAITSIANAELKNLVITGTEGSFSLATATTGLGALKTIDASGYAGDVTIGKTTAITQTTTTTYKGGSGADKVYLGGIFADGAAASKYDGGAGDAIDTLVITTGTAFGSAQAAIINKATNWDVLEMGAANVATLAADAFNINDFVFGNTSTGTAVSGVKSDDSFTFKAALSGGTASGTTGADVFTFAGSTTRSDIHITLDGSADITGQAGNANAGGAGYAGAAGLKVSSFDTLYINSTGKAHTITGGAGGASTNSNDAGGAGGAGITLADGNEIVITGTADLTIVGGAGGAGNGNGAAGAAGASFIHASGIKLNAADFEGKLTTGGSAGADTIVVGKGGSVITGTADLDTITFGAGADKYVGGVKALANMDTVENFTVGVDKFALAANSTTTGSSSTVYLAGAYEAGKTDTLQAALEAALPTAKLLASHKWAVVTITGSSADVNGTYVINNLDNAGYAAGDDAVIKVELTGTDALTAGDFLV